MLKSGHALCTTYSNCRCSSIWQHQYYNCIQFVHSNPTLHYTAYLSCCFLHISIGKIFSSAHYSGLMMQWLSRCRDQSNRAKRCLEIPTRSSSSSCAWPCRCSAVENQHQEQVQPPSQLLQGRHHFPDCCGYSALATHNRI